MRLPYSLRVLRENVVRAGLVGEGDPEEARAILEWQPGDEPRQPGQLAGRDDEVDVLGRDRGPLGEPAP